MSCRSVQLDAGAVLEHPEADSVPPAQELLLRVYAHVQAVVEQVSLAKNVRAQARARSERLQAGRPVRAPGRGVQGHLPKQPSRDRDALLA
jgi:hypothetical protein